MPIIYGRKINLSRKILFSAYYSQKTLYRLRDEDFLNHKDTKNTKLFPDLRQGRLCELCAFVVQVGLRL